MTAKHWRLEHDGTFRETEPGRGAWVYHADHKREVAQLQARVAELEASSHNYFEERNQARETVRGYQAEAGSLRAALSALVQEYEGYFEGAPEPKSLIDAREVLSS